mgnify:CR=1 FL=1
MNRPIENWYTDGSCSGNPGPGGWGSVHLIPDSNKYILEYMKGTEQNTTNNRMELTAMLETVAFVAADPDTWYNIYSDSAYTVNICNNWIFTWAAEGWKRSKDQPIENLDLIKELYMYLKQPFANFSIYKIPGHANCVGNELADALATNNINKLNKIKKDYEIIKEYNVE